MITVGLGLGFGLGLRLRIVVYEMLEKVTKCGFNHVIKTDQWRAAPLRSAFCHVPCLRIAVHLPETKAYSARKPKRSEGHNDEDDEDG